MNEVETLKKLENYLKGAPSVSKLVSSLGNKYITCHKCTVSLVDSGDSVQVDFFCFKSKKYKLFWS